MNKSPNSNKKYVFVLPKAFLEKTEDDDNCLFTTVQLPNPKTHEKEMFLLKKAAGKTTVCEVNCHLSDPSSWFIGEKIYRVFFLLCAVFDRVSHLHFSSDFVHRYLIFFERLDAIK